VPASSRGKSSSSRWLLMAGATLGVLTIATGLLFALGGASWFRSARGDLITHKVKKGNLPLTIVEKGTLESASNVDIFCRVKTGSAGSAGLPQIKEVIPDGTHVNKGDLLVDIEATRFEDQLKQQKIQVDSADSLRIQAEENYKITLIENQSLIRTAQIAIDLAELDLKKYLEGEYLQTLKDIEGRTQMAESDLVMWQDRAAWSERMVRLGYLTLSQAQSERSRMASATIALDRVREERRVLNEFTFRRTKVQLESAVEEAKRNLRKVEAQARSNEKKTETEWKTRESIYQQELAKYKEIEGEIAKCKIYAPQDGLVVYHIPESSSRSSGGGPRSMIAQGESVWEGQKLMRIPDLKNMQVNVRVHEAMVSRVKPGQMAMIRVDAFANTHPPLKGRVKWVANVSAKSDGWSSSTDVKVYPTIVTIENEENCPDLRPDMSAEVTVHTEHELKDVLIVPTQAILTTVESGKLIRKCYVKTDKGEEERELVLGLSNDTHAHVKEGLQEGEEVVLNPRVLLGEKEREKLINTMERPPSAKGSQSADRDRGENGFRPPEGIGDGPQPGGMPKSKGGPGGSKKGPPRDKSGDQ
jgi:multidrug resistance efflux pump